MKKIALILSSMAFVASVANAEVLHCDATYQGKRFVQVTIWSGVDGFGPLECDYKNPGEQNVTVYHYPSQQEYYRVSGNWRSTMPGYQWCAIEDGNSYDTCLFAKREKAAT